MVFFWTAAAQIAAKMDRLKAAEAKLLELAKSNWKGRDGTLPTVRVTDTRIPASVVPISTASATTGSCLSGAEEQVNTEECYNIHGIEVTNNNNNEAAGTADNSKPPPPLVLLHGYMNGGAYFYRNLMGLSVHFAKIHALDLLGWGLSSRPNFARLQQTSTSDDYDCSKCMIKTTEDFFVESLEAWRKEQKIDSMILAGHSMGGYLSVAYSERYPQHVQKLILISPAGVPEETIQEIKRREQKYLQSYRSRLFYSLYSSLFRRGYTGGDLLRAMSEKRGRLWMEQYVTRRLPAINDPEEQQTLTDYLYYNNTLPGSGEYCLSKLLKPSVFGRKPLQHRIPNLNVKSVSFLYGENDWMDATGGMLVEQACSQQKLLQGDASVPDIQVYQIAKAGHLLMLENSAEFNNGLVMAAASTGKEPLSLGREAPLPKRLMATIQQHQDLTLSQEERRAADYQGTEVAA